MPAAAANGLTLDYESFGDPAAPVVLLVMGLGMPALAWPDEFVDALVAAGFRVVRFDNRDCGHSTRLRGAPLPSAPWAIARALLRLPVHAPYTLDDMAADTVGLLDALGIERAHVVGASLGGMIAQVVAARYPARTASLVSIMSATGNPRPRVAFGRRHALRAILSRPLDPGDVNRVVDHLVHVFGVIGSPGFPTDQRLLRDRLERVARRGWYPAGTLRQLVAILASGDRRPLLARIAAPTLVIHGRDDPLVPLAAGEDTARTIRGARLEVIDGMGHDLPPGALPILADRIVRFCRTVEAARAGAPVTSA
ncbi:alpha/beta hydrolase [Betaproteobacteria bacterium PRO7]|jgi:pimeloyl-ACP methyl ester carboxylesterase|nr:alpha/beta hydrolase [Betaproteobacteria bacterium PRO7]